MLYFHCTCTDGSVGPPEASPLYMMSPCVRLKGLDLDLCFQFKKKISPFIRTLTNLDPGGPSMFPSSLQDLLGSPSEPVNPNEIHTVCLCLCRLQAATKHCGLFIVHSLWPPLVVEVGAVTSDWGNSATSPKRRLKWNMNAPLLRKWEDEDCCRAHNSSQVKWPNIRSCWGLRLTVFSVAHVENLKNWWNLITNNFI